MGKHKLPWHLSSTAVLLPLGVKCLSHRRYASVKWKGKGDKTIMYMVQIPWSSSMDSNQRLLMVNSKPPSGSWCLREGHLLVVQPQMTLNDRLTRPQKHTTKIKDADLDLCNRGKLTKTYKILVWLCDIPTRFKSIINVNLAESAENTTSCKSHFGGSWHTSSWLPLIQKCNKNRQLLTVLGN